MSGGDQARLEGLLRLDSRQQSLPSDHHLGRTKAGQLLNSPTRIGVPQVLDSLELRAWEKWEEMLRHQDQNVQAQTLDPHRHVQETWALLDMKKSQKHHHVHVQQMVAVMVLDQVDLVFTFHKRRLKVLHLLSVQELHHS